jgi:hypothetical protein
MNCPRDTRHRLKSMFFFGLLAFLFAALPSLAKTATDFDPNLDFSKYKSFAFLGSVENMVMLQIPQDLIDLRVHHAVTRELSKKGLREVQPNENPDLVVRYWATTSQEINISVLGKWAPYSAYIDSYWAPIYNDVAAQSARDSSLVLDLIDPKTKNLAWRLYLIHKITMPEKEWKKADDEISKAFDSYPPSDKEKGEKKKERSAHPPKPG